MILFSSRHQRYSPGFFLYLTAPMSSEEKIAAMGLVFNRNFKKMSKRNKKVSLGIKIHILPTIFFTDKKGLASNFHAHRPHLG